MHIGEVKCHQSAARGLKDAAVVSKHEAGGFIWDLQEDGERSGGGFFMLGTKHKNYI